MKKLTKDNVTEIIKDGREDLGISQAELSRRMHTNKCTMSYWERGKTDMHVEDFLDLMDLLGIEVYVK